VAEFVSPVDGHKHFADVGRTACAVCKLEAERDRLRDILDADNGPVAKTMEYLGRVEAERDLWFTALHEIAVAVEGELTRADPPAVELVDLVRRAMAERDRLRDELDAVRPQYEGHVRTLIAALDAANNAAEAAGAAVGNMAAKLSDVMAEADRLRDALALVYFHLGPPQPRLADHLQVPKLVERAMAERDRLRAVVRRAQEAWVKHVEHDHDDESDPSLDEWMAAWDELRALDVSGDTGDKDSTEGGPHQATGGAGSPALEHPTDERVAGAGKHSGDPSGNTGGDDDLPDASHGMIL
jgi:hypothetical protein